MSKKNKNQSIEAKIEAKVDKVIVKLDSQADELSSLILKFLGKVKEEFRVEVLLHAVCLVYMSLFPNLSRRLESMIATLAERSIRKAVKKYKAKYSNTDQSPTPNSNPSFDISDLFRSVNPITQPLPNDYSEMRRKLEEELFKALSIPKSIIRGPITKMEFGSKDQQVDTPTKNPTTAPEGYELVPHDELMELPRCESDKSEIHIPEGWMYLVTKDTGESYQWKASGGHSNVMIIDEMELVYARPIKVEETKKDPTVEVPNGFELVSKEELLNLPREGTSTLIPEGWKCKDVADDEWTPSCGTPDTSIIQRGYMMYCKPIPPAQSKPSPQEDVKGKILEETELFNEIKAEEGF